MVNDACSKAGTGLLLGFLCACAGADPQPLPAALNPPNRPSPGPVEPEAPADPDLGLDLRGFAAKVVEAYRHDPGPVAVLPAFTDDPQHPAGTRVFATAAGDWLASRTCGHLLDLAADDDFDLWQPATLPPLLAKVNRGLSDLSRPADAVPLLAQAGAAYVVFGEIRAERVGDPFSGGWEVPVAWRCVSVAGRRAVDQLAVTVTDAAAVAEFCAKLRRDSSLEVGARAPQFVPKLDAELRLAVRRALLQLATRYRAAVAGRVLVVRVAAGGRSGDAAPLQTVRAELEAQLPRLLAGDEAVRVAATGTELRAMLARQVDSWQLETVLAAGSSGQVAVQVPLDGRFNPELDRLLR